MEACRSIGVQVPHLCYHPALKVVGSCRLCKVEVVRNDRRWIDISCKLEVADGMEIFTDSPAVVKARRMTLEFLLANHPLDCPVCDEAGECKLQDFYFQYALHDSRMIEVKTRKHKAQDVGPSIVLDGERCVLCSRCVRFLADITHTFELGIFGMGSREELSVKPGGRLDNEYAGNVVDICPVGALTDKDFRFKRRVWYLRSAPSVCQLCSRGCNVRIDYDLDPYHINKRTFQMRTHRTEATAYQRIQRVKPRPNQAVNGYWICDLGRYGYRSTDTADRLLTAMLRSEDELKSVSLPDAVRAMAKGLGSALKGTKNKLAVVVSPLLTNEEVFAVWSLFHEKLALPNLDHRLPIDPDWTGDDLLRTPDPFPNRMGCEWIGFLPGEDGVGVKELPDAIRSGKVDTLISILADPMMFLDEPAVKRLKRRYIIARELTEGSRSWADVMLPAAAWGEYRGTFTNFQGRVQRLEAAFEPLGDARPVWSLMVELSAALKKNLRWKSADEVLRSIGLSVRLFQGLALDEIDAEGVMLGSQGKRAAG